MITLLYYIMVMSSYVSHKHYTQRNFYFLRWIIHLASVSYEISESSSLLWNGGWKYPYSNRLSLLLMIICVETTKAQKSSLWAVILWRYLCFKTPYCLNRLLTVSWQLRHLCCINSVLVGLTKLAGHLTYCWSSPI